MNDEKTCRHNLYYSIFDASRLDQDGKQDVKLDNELALLFGRERFLLLKKGYNSPTVDGVDCDKVVFANVWNSMLERYKREGALKELNISDAVFDELVKGSTTFSACFPAIRSNKDLFDGFKDQQGYKDIEMSKGKLEKVIGTLKGLVKDHVGIDISNISKNFKNLGKKKGSDNLTPYEARVAKMVPTPKKVAMTVISFCVFPMPNVPLVSVVLMLLPGILAGLGLSKVKGFLPDAPGSISSGVFDNTRSESSQEINVVGYGARNISLLKDRKVSQGNLGSVRSATLSNDKKTDDKKAKSVSERIRESRRNEESGKSIRGF